MALDPSTGLLSGTPARPGRFNFTVRVADSSPAPGNVISQRLSLAVSPGDVARLVFLSQPGSAPANSPLAPFQVLALDGFGNPLSGVVIRLQLVSLLKAWPGAVSPGSVLQTTTVNGVATFTNVAVTTRGRYELSADAGLVDEPSDPFVVGRMGRGS
jgi:hypothetical protein